MEKIFITRRIYLLRAENIYYVEKIFITWRKHLLRGEDIYYAEKTFITWIKYVCLFVCWSLTSLCHSNGHIETMPAREINPFTARDQDSIPVSQDNNDTTSKHSEWTRQRIRPLSHRGWLDKIFITWRKHLWRIVYFVCFISWENISSM